MSRPKDEASMLPSVLRLFPKKKYLRYAEVPLGRKRLDLLCVERDQDDASVAVELKIEKWKDALWQAVIDLQAAERAYVAIWHAYAHRVEKHEELFRRYGVGIISVTERGARIVLESETRPRRIPRAKKPAFYSALLNQV